MKISEDLEKLLPFGYLFLIVMGILKDSIQYYQLGINILKFSTIVDVLMSPLVYITSNPIILITIILLFASHFYLPKFLLENKNKITVQKMFDLKSDEELTLEQKKSYYNQIAIRTLAVILLSFFMGTGVASGYFTSQRIAKGKLDYNYQLNFNDGDPEEVNLVGTNSLYYFYVAKGQKHIKIAPIGSIKNVELLYTTASK
ncbi:hypothetical protein HNP37_004132 [Flavobacterium nitrogenifigens]|uniref:Uncharacterized protein n=2 Tax=Flavobacterium TaxID=237 RepID=A0A7W7J0P1_9FLAO|nr:MULTISPECIES: hypothetical protein [Flavobacterium]MBB4804052.1 hypothetical protein [Flavobacterium nitrogenifigens]MBB6388796.1 hypothetical protein [Flavobacterium notoginsengisoli]